MTTHLATDEQASVEAGGSPIKVKKISHIVFEVSDLRRSIEFWTQIMGFAVSDVNEKGMVFLHNGPDHHGIGLIEAPGKSRPPAEAGLRLSHFAFEVDSIETMFKIRQFLRDQGVEITFEGRHGPGGNIDLAFKDPDGYSIEVNCGMDQLAPDGTYRPASQYHRTNSLEEAVANPLPATW